MGGESWGCPEPPLCATYISVGAVSGSASLTTSQGTRIHCVASLSLSGKWIYEVLISSQGLMQIGWCTLNCRFNQEVVQLLWGMLLHCFFGQCRALHWCCPLLAFTLKMQYTNTKCQACYFKSLYKTLWSVSTEWCSMRKLVLGMLMCSCCM